MNGKKMRCELVSWYETQRLCQRLAKLLDAAEYRPDLVVAIGRGGYVPARLLCDYLDLMALTSIKIEHYTSGSTRQAQALIRYPLSTDVEGQRVLIVDDVNDSGDTLRIAVEHVQSLQPAEVRVAVMHNKVVSNFEVEFYAKKIVKWRWLIYPWALHEDISAFIRRLSPAPENMQEAQAFLAEQFDIHISLQKLRDVYEFMR